MIPFKPGPNEVILKPKAMIGLFLAAATTVGFSGPLGSNMGRGTIQLEYEPAVFCFINIIMIACFSMFNIRVLFINRHTLRLFS